MIDYSTRYQGTGDYDRRAFARNVIDSDDTVCHVVVGYNDSDYSYIKTFLIFDSQVEWDSWVSLYQGLGGFIDACHR